MIKKYLLSTLFLAVFLLVFVPFASSSPDGLETVVSSIGIQPQFLWQGFMANYSVSVLGEGYVSTLVSGFVGVVLVLAATFALGKAISKRSKTKIENP